MMNPDNSANPKLYARFAAVALARGDLGTGRCRGAAPRWRPGRTMCLLPRYGVDPADLASPRLVAPGSLDGVQLMPYGGAAREIPGRRRSVGVLMTPSPAGRSCKSCSTPGPR